VDWSNELFVRLYIRDSADWRVLPWQSRLLFPALMRKVDRAGVLETKHGVRGVAVLVDAPVDFVTVGMDGLLADGCVVQHERGYLLPNFMAAQEANMSDKARAKLYRDKRKAEALASVTGRDAGVTRREFNVTEHHAPSRVVTLRREEEIREEERQGGAGGAPLAAGPTASQSNGRQGRKKPKPSDPTPEESLAIERVLAKLSERTGREYRATTLAHARRVLRLLRDRDPGQSLHDREMDLRKVVWDRANEWAEDPKMSQYLRPSTLFGPEKFPDYLAQARAADAAYRASNGRRDERAPTGAVMAALAAATEGE
jgi:uncharacterized phage protein (TIGR02220 family)